MPIFLAWFLYRYKWVKENHRAIHMIGRVAHSEDQYLLLLFDHASCYSIASYSNYALLLVNTASVVFIQMYIHLFGICDWMMAYNSGTRKRVECRQSTLHVIIKCTTWLIEPLLQEYIIFNDMILTRIINGYLHVIEKKEYQVCGWLVWQSRRMNLVLRLLICRLNPRRDRAILLFPPLCSSHTLW